MGGQNEKKKIIMLYDLSLALTTASPVYPGDVPLTIKTDSLQTSAGSLLTSHFHCSCHFGTHIDFPSHMGFSKNSSHYNIEQLCGPGIIIDIPAHITCIKAEHIPIFSNKISIVFFKTNNSLQAILKEGKNFPENYVCIDISTAKKLIELGVQIVGIDGPSVDSLNEPDLSVHRLLLSQEILIVEGLELSKISTGLYDIIIAPIKLQGVDGAPVRVIARDL
jgi:arylformamidase